MLDVVYAVRFVKELSTGRNRPWLLEVERTDGSVVNVVAKLGSAECGPSGLVRESYAAMMAADLGLPVAEPFVVSIQQDFVETLPASQKERVTAGELAFGSAFAATMFPVQPNAKLDSVGLDEAISALTFDGAIVNSDRLVTRPNCLTDGRRLLLIDHELSLNVHGRGFLMIDPWLPSGLSNMTYGVAEHVFYSSAKAADSNRKHSRVSETCQALAAIVPERIEQYFDAIPPEWHQDGVPGQIRDFLKELVSNAKDLQAQVEGVLQ